MKDAINHPLAIRSLATLLHVITQMEQIHGTFLEHDARREALDVLANQSLPDRGMFPIAETARRAIENTQTFANVPNPSLAYQVKVDALIRAVENHLNPLKDRQPAHEALRSALFNLQA